MDLERAGYNLYYLGLNVFSHDTSACIFKDGKLLVAIEEERLNFKKHTREFPYKAIQSCLNYLKITPNDVSNICIGWNIDEIIKERYFKNLKNFVYFKKLVKDRKKEITRLLEIEDNLKKLNFDCKISYFDHHDCHNYYSYGTSNFKNSAFLCLDGYGELNSGSLGYFKKNDYIKLKTFNLNNSLGLLYASLTDYLGFKPYSDEGIVMGLSSYGNFNKKFKKQSYINFFRKKILYKNGEIIINKNYFTFGLTREGWVSKTFIKYFGKKRAHGSRILPHHKNIAAAIQQRLEEICVGILKYLKKQINSNNLCLSGGVALNCVMNGKMHSKSNFKNINVPSSPGDSGVAVGAVLMMLRDKYGKFYKCTKSPYLGPKYKKIKKIELLKKIKNKKIKIKKLKNNFNFIANQLMDKKIIAIFHGRSEFGPRALGNRSIITSTRGQEMKDYLNIRVKFRESFRPFAPIVLDKYSNKFFKIEGDSFNMTKTFSVKLKKGLEAVTHVDNSARVQIVSKESNGNIYKILKEYFKVSKIPVLLNTSFNVKGQPIVEFQKSAVKTFLKTNIDILVVDEFILVKL